MKGIVLAGGTGSRLYPMTRVVSKQLQPVFDKPMVYYPLTTLLEGGIRDICVISTPQDLPLFQRLLGDGNRFGARFVYLEQAEPRGIAEAFIIAREFLAGEAVTLVLGDNMFHGAGEFSSVLKGFEQGAHIFAYEVDDPSRYGVVDFDDSGKALSIEEKPGTPKSNYAVPGLYVYDRNVVEIAESLKPSARGELEITDVNLSYLADNSLSVTRLSRGAAWLDAGTTSSLHEASAYVQTIEKRTGVKVGCPEEAAFRSGLLSLDKLRDVISAMPQCEYRDYLEKIVRRSSS